MNNVRVIRAPGTGKVDSTFEHHAGVVAETVGAEQLAFQLVRVQPGVRSQAHQHEHETAGYVLEGELVVWFGEGLVKHVTARAGDFLFIPAKEPHVLASYGAEVVALVARNDAGAQETAKILPELDRLAHLLEPPSRLPPPRAPRRPV